MTAYYRIVDDLSVPNRWFVGAPVSSTGEEVDPRTFTKGIRVENIEALIAPLRHPGVPLDFASADFGMPVVSDRVGNVLTSVVPDAVQLIPVAVEGAPTGYQIMNVTRRVQCLDEDSSDVEWWTEADGRPEKAGQYRAIRELRVDLSLANSLGHARRPYHAGMEIFLGALLIFCLRICDVSIGTLRTLYMVRGDRLRAVPLAFAESGIWVLAISRIMGELNNPYNFIGYAGGFAAGTYVGITLERWIASGWVLVRVVGSDQPTTMISLIRAAGFGLTVVHGEGRQGRQCILFVVTLRKRGPELLHLVRENDPDAFVTIEPVQTAVGGFLPQSMGAAGVRK